METALCQNYPNKISGGMRTNPNQKVQDLVEALTAKERRRAAALPSWRDKRITFFFRSENCSKNLREAC